MDEIKAILEKIGAVSEKVNVDAVFGKPEIAGDRVLIPVAEVSYGFGMGAGIAPRGDAEAPVEEDVTSEIQEPAVKPAVKPAAGGGGGAGGRARPIAYIEIGPDGTRVESIMDEQKVALAGILLSAWAIGWVGLVLKILFSPRRQSDSCC